MQSFSTDILALFGEAALLVRHGRVHFANSAACQILGADCGGKPVKELLGPVIAETQAASFVMDQSINGRHYAVRVNRFDDGQLIFLSPCSSSPLLLSDALIFSLRNSLMNFNISLDALRTRAELLGDEQLLLSLRSISHSYYKMTRLLSNASTALAVADGSILFAPGELDLAEFIASTADTVNMLCPGVETRFCGGEAHPITADRQLIELMLMNLISNALVHADGCTRININLLESKDSLIISVDDDGCGIAPDQLGTVFDRYCHGFDISSLLSGAGLGLTVARSIAHLHGGTLLLESRQGIGTTVRVSLSRHIGGAPLRSPQESWETAGMQNILTALADYLPDDCYTENFMD